jgi:hypothetical protein
MLYESESAHKKILERVEKTDRKANGWNRMTQN